MADTIGAGAAMAGSATADLRVAPATILDQPSARCAPGSPNLGTPADAPASVSVAHPAEPLRSGTSTTMEAGA